MYKYFCVFYGFQNEAVDTLDKLECPIKNIDEFTHFKKILIELKQSNLQGFKFLIGGCTELMKSTLKEVTKIKRNENENGIRRIVKIKTKKNLT